MTARPPAGATPASASPVRTSWLVLVALAILWTLAQLRVVTYVVTSDPKLYIGLARSLDELPPGSDSWRHALSQISPLWPGLLALSRRVGGPAAPYWLNWLLGVGWFAALRVLAVRRWGEGTTAGLVLAGVPAILLNAHPLEPEWLLHPYREMGAVLGLTAVWASVADLPVSPRRWLAAGAFGLFAAAAREPTALVLVGPALAAATRPGASARPRATALAALAAPSLAAVALWWFTRSDSGLAAWTGQLHGFRYELLELGRWRRFGPNLRDLSVLFFRGMGVIGIVGAVLGWGRCARRRDPAGWMGAAAVLLTIPLYAVFLAAPRYLTIAWLGGAWMAAEGWAATLGWLGYRWPQLGSRASSGGVGVALAAVAFAAVREPSITLGPRFGWRETQEAAARVDRAAAGRPVFVERDCRFAESLVLHHAHAPLLWPEMLRNGPPSGAVFLQPLNRACFSKARVQRGGATVGEWLRQHGRWIPAEEGGTTNTMALGEGQYQLWRLVAWTAAVPPVAEGSLEWPDDAAALWLDLRCAPIRRWTFRWRPRNGENDSQMVWVGEGTGLHVLAVPDVVRARAGEWRLEGDGPVPDEPVAAIQRGDRPVRFELGPYRRLSAMRWFEPPFLIGALADPYGVAMRDGGRIRLPVVRTAEGLAAPVRLRVALDFCPVGSFTGATVIVRTDKCELARANVGRRRRAVEWTHDLQVAHDLDVSLECVPALTPRGFLRLEAIHIALTDAEPATP